MPEEVAAANHQHIAVRKLALPDGSGGLRSSTLLVARFAAGRDESANSLRWRDILGDITFSTGGQR